MKAYMFPGQGSQFKGMGQGLFEDFSYYTRQADEILGYSIKELCLNDPKGVLSRTEYTQPALYTVNALSYLRNQAEGDRKPDFFLGHSLGEYNALHASGAISFAQGLKLVQARGRLMSDAGDGGMAAILNLAPAEVDRIAASPELTGLDVANYNSFRQVVVSGPKSLLVTAEQLFTQAGGMFVPLNVSAAFHSRLMRGIAEKFQAVLASAEFHQYDRPVVANVHAQFYEDNNLRSLLGQQIYSSVQWVNSVEFLIAQGVTEFKEIGPGDVLTKLVKNIRENTRIPANSTASVAGTSVPKKNINGNAITEKIITGINGTTKKIHPADLGSQDFRRHYNIKYSYVSGAMAKAIASSELVVKMGKAGMLGYYGTGGVPLPVIEDAIKDIQGKLCNGEAYGMNLLCNLVNPPAEMRTIDLFLKYGVTNVEAAAYTQITPSLVKYRLAGLSRDSQGKVVIKNRIMAKISRPEVADVFLKPAPLRIMQSLLDEGHITRTQMDLAQRISMADDICVEADSGGHTDGGNIAVLLPTMIRLRDEIAQQKMCDNHVRVGGAGGIGTPESAAAAFMLGADFILTGSINQCTVEAGISDQAKDLLAEINVQDTEYAPAGDMFEIGARVQVLKRSVLFPSRANKLHELWRLHESWESIDEKTRRNIEERFFKRTFESAYQETKDYYLKVNPQQIEKAELNPKHKMALVFRWYFVYSLRLSMSGDQTDPSNYQIHTGPALGAFNQWVKNTELQNWRQRNVDKIGEKLMEATADLIGKRLREISPQ